MSQEKSLKNYIMYGSKFKTFKRIKKFRTLSQKYFNSGVRFSTPSAKIMSVHWNNPNWWESSCKFWPCFLWVLQLYNASLDQVCCPILEKSFQLDFRKRN
ncbi:GSCOCG00010479001-RA-CDS [Cotesia congregata]|nr:GSCOCG00010479001-RA-CDS [Cotesia congregata]